MRRAAKSIFLGSTIAILVFVSNLSGQGTRLLRDPDISETKIAFVHANDIWTVNREGGEAKRLTLSLIHI